MILPTFYENQTNPLTASCIHLSLSLFYQLNACCSCLHVGRRAAWYFTSVDGTIKRKHKAKLDPQFLGFSPSLFDRLSMLLNIFNDTNDAKKND